VREPKEYGASIGKQYSMRRSAMARRMNEVAGSRMILRIERDQVDMYEGQKDLFREAMEEVKKTDSWEGLTPSQKETLVTKYLRDHFEMSGR
jgi:hypothetical protein